MALCLKSGWTHQEAIGGFIDGDLKLRVPMSIDVEVDNSSGDVFASNLSGRSLSFESSSGSLEIEDINSDLFLKSSSGDIELEGFSR